MEVETKLFKIKLDNTSRIDLIKTLTLKHTVYAPPLGQYWQYKLLDSGHILIQKFYYIYFSNNNFDFEVGSSPVGVLIIGPTSDLIDIEYLSNSERSEKIKKHLHEVLTEINPRR